MIRKVLGTEYNITELKHTVYIRKRIKLPLIDCAFVNGRRYYLKSVQRCVLVRNGLICCLTAYSVIKDGCCVLDDV